MNKCLNTLSPDEARLEEDVHAVFDEVGGPLTMDEIIRRVRHRQLQRVVDGLVKEGHAREVELGKYTFTKTGLERLVRAE